jgi:hypothetical protein
LLDREKRVRREWLEACFALATKTGPRKATMIAGRYFRRNAPDRYRPDALPADLIPPA